MANADPRSRQELLLAVRKGFRPRYVFFWGHKPLPSGEIGLPCFSQWWPSTFVIEGISYPTAEHYMMAAKARLFGDEAQLKQVLTAKGPAAAKQLGRKVIGFREDSWVSCRFEIVVRGNYEKFKQNPELSRFLIGTGNKVLVEASPVDRIWGIGLSGTDKRVTNAELWGA